METPIVQPANKKPKRLIQSPLRLLGFGIAIVILGPLNPVINPRAVAEHWGIQPSSWQDFVLIGVWVTIIYLLYAVFLSVVELATKRRRGTGGAAE